MTNGNGAGGKRRPLFTSAERGRLLKQSVGKPSGVIVEIGGVEFDLLPLSTAQGDDVFELIGKFGALWESARGGALVESQLATAIQGEAARIMRLARGLLADAAKAADGEEFEPAVFDEWFAALPLVPMVRALLPKLLEANGLSSLGNALAPTAASTVPAQTENPSA